jgi:hypothetical protein
LGLEEFRKEKGFPCIVLVGCLKSILSV